MPGAFIAIEGPDGSGKTTLARRLAIRLRDRGLDVLEVREPGGTPVAEATRKVILDPSHQVAPVAELYLYLAARADLVAQVIQPALAAGRVVLTDRFDLSTEAYQVAGRGLPRDAVLSANRFATGGLKPDITIVLDVPQQVGLARLAGARPPDRLEQAGDGLHARAAEAFANATGRDVIHIDATPGPAVVESRAWEVLQARLAETFPIGKG